MNERIKEFAEKAGLQPYYDAQDEAIERFARLIVKECCQFNYDLLESYQEACEINSEIREYFGVK